MLLCAGVSCDRMKVSGVHFPSPSHELLLIACFWLLADKVGQPMRDLRYHLAKLSKFHRQGLQRSFKALGSRLR